MKRASASGCCISSSRQGRRDSWRFAQELYDPATRRTFLSPARDGSGLSIGLARHAPPEGAHRRARRRRIRPMNPGRWRRWYVLAGESVHIIFDNGSLLSTGGFDSRTTSGITDPRRSQGAGLEHVEAVDSVDLRRGGDRGVQARRAERDRREGRGGRLNHYGMDLQLPRMRSVRRIGGRKKR